MGSISSRKPCPRFIWSSQDALELLKGQLRAVGAHLAQWQWGWGASIVAHTEVLVKPRLLRAKRSPQHLGVKLLRPDMDRAMEEDTGRGSSDSMAWPIPRGTETFGPG
ncbi:hypothetical protein WISP_00039 [Willisornis vidua]|uniref:Uncharacterized protein n=1 Tax=Willisornis vidua TaxID=1566151 RepID=A0ABQ9DWF2_9PASS|nr:hypothetical protein WISP_00039 [Willisornis vidua]